MSVPSNNPRYEMLEVKLASYVDFPSKIDKGGIFVCCSDTFEAYSDDGIPWKFAESGLLKKFVVLKQNILTLTVYNDESTSSTRPTHLSEGKP